MSDSSELARLSECGRAPLEFPSGDGFTPLEHCYSVEQVLELSEERLEFLTSAPGFEVERLASKCAIPFRLLS